MMAGSYRVPLNDPVFGISSGSIACENPGHRPIPAPTPPPPCRECRILICGNSQSKQKRIDDRQSFKRVRHRQKKKQGVQE